MKKTFILGMLAFGMAVITSCGSMPGTTAGTTPTTPAETQTSNASQSGSALGSLLSGLTSAQGGNSGVGNIIGQILGSVTGTNTIVGSWSYTEPTIQFESESLLAQAGGAMATKSIVDKVKPYYEKIGIKAGTLGYTFNEDKTCTVSMGGKNISGTYEYDSKSNTLVITNQLGIKIMTAYATVSANNLALTFDATKLLTLAQTLGAKSTNTTVSGLTSISKSFNGMKMGFMCVRK